MDWTKQETELLEKYFATNWTEMTLYKRLHKFNPNRSYEAMTRRLRAMRAKGYKKDKEKALSSLRIGYLDIEATSLNATFGMIITWYIKTREKNEYFSSRITQKEILDRTCDKRVIKDLMKTFNNYDVLYTHYGSDRRFDLPFIRTRLLWHGMEKEFPDYGEKFIMDTYPIARNKLRLCSNRLGSIAQACGIKGVKKTPLDYRVWQDAAIGDENALDYICVHNKRDVQLLEKVHRKLEKFENYPLRSF